MKRNNLIRAIALALMLTLLAACVPVRRSSNAEAEGISAYAEAPAMPATPVSAAIAPMNAGSIGDGMRSERAAVWASALENPHPTGGVWESFFQNAPFGSSGKAPGTFFFDDAGISWLILHRLENGRMLVITEHVFGSGPPTASFSFIRYHSTNVFVQLRDAEINTRLTTFWDQMGADMRAMALSVDLGTDFRTEPDNWPSSRDTEIAPPATHLPGMTGMSQPGRARANSGNSLFLLSVVEAMRYFTPDHNRTTGLQATCINGNITSWFLRSPGTSAEQPIARVRQGAPQIASGAASSHWSFRPALWINP